MNEQEKKSRFVTTLEEFGFSGFKVKRTPEEIEKLFGWKKKLKPETERSKHFIYRDCGTGAGGFKAGNACAKGGDGDGDFGADDGTEWEFNSPNGLGENMKTVLIVNAAHRDRQDVLESMDLLTPEAKANINKAHRLLHDAEVKYVLSAADETKTAKDMNDQWLLLQNKNADALEAYIKNVPEDQRSEMNAKLVDATVATLNGQPHIGMHISVDTHNFLKGTAKGKKGEITPPNTNPLHLNQLMQAVAQRNIFFEKPQGAFELMMSNKIRSASDRGGWTACFVARSLNGVGVGGDRMEVGNSYDFKTSILHEMAHGQHRTEQEKFYFQRNTLLGGIITNADNRKMRKMCKNSQVKIRAYGKTNMFEYVACTVERLRKGEQLNPYEWDIYDKCTPPTIRPSIRKKLTTSEPRPVPKRKPARKKPTKKKEEP